jgi:hypothetical protein
MVRLVPIFPTALAHLSSIAGIGPFRIVPFVPLTAGISATAADAAVV